ncbi:MAG: zf-HC2 domain-containing protein [Chloroflexi bacterium]|jgi:anti-sigma factor (TIGR02949 family)|nr:zf-HC2 domain-containing protein [Chloroflexota bacterium]
MAETTFTSCEGLLGSLSDYIDGELGAELCRQIEKHVAECENCRIVVDTTRKTIDLVHVSNASETGLPEDVRDRLFKRLNLDDYLKPSAK